MICVPGVSGSARGTDSARGVSWGRSDVQAHQYAKWTLGLCVVRHAPRTNFV